MRLPHRPKERMKQLEREEDYHMSTAAIARVREEMVRLVKERPMAADEVRRMAEMGDLSENAGYMVAKAHLRQLNNRITTLEERLKHAIEIPEGTDPSGRIRIGSTVALRANGKEMTFQILGSHETNPGRGRISHLSQLGSILLGHQAGETVVLTSVERPVTYEIIDVK